MEIVWIDGQIHYIEVPPPPARRARCGLLRFRSSTPLLCQSPVCSVSLRAQAGMAQMLKGGVIMDVVDVEQARIAEEAGAPSLAATSPREPATLTTLTAPSPRSLCDHGAGARARRHP